MSKSGELYEQLYIPKLCPFCRGIVVGGLCMNCNTFVDDTLVTDEEDEDEDCY